MGVDVYLPDEPGTTACLPLQRRISEYRQVDPGAANVSDQQHKSLPCLTGQRVTGQLPPAAR